MALVANSMLCTKEISEYLRECPYVHSRVTVSEKIRSREILRLASVLSKFFSIKCLTLNDMHGNITVMFEGRTTMAWECEKWFSLLSKHILLKKFELRRLFASHNVYKRNMIAAMCNEYVSGWVDGLDNQLKKIKKYIKYNKNTSKLFRHDQVDDYVHSLMSWNGETRECKTSAYCNGFSDGKNWDMENFLEGMGW